MSSEYGVDLEHLDQVVAKLSGLTEFLTDTFDEIDRRDERSTKTLLSFVMGASSPGQRDTCPSAVNHREPRVIE